MGRVLASLEKVIVPVRLEASTSDSGMTELLRRRRRLDAGGRGVKVEPRGVEPVRGTYVHVSIVTSRI